MPREKGVWTYYVVEGDKLVRKLPFCERCGPGVFMADHGDRWHCGKCGLTKFKSEPRAERGRRKRGRS